MGVEDEVEPNIARKLFDQVFDTIAAIKSSLNYLVGNDEAEAEAMAKVLSGEAYTLDLNRDVMCQLNMLSDGATPSDDDCTKAPSGKTIQDTFNNSNELKVEGVNKVIETTDPSPEASILENGL